MNRSPSATARAVVISLAVSVLLGLLVAWFAWPSARLAPRDLPVVVAGPPPAANAVAQRLASIEEGAFKVTVVADAAAADQALRDRSAYAAFVLGPGGPGAMSVHTASAASPAVAALITASVQQLAGAGQPVTVVDVVPTSADDPRGAGFAAGLLPLVLVGLIAGALLWLLVPQTRARFAGLGLVSFCAGTCGAAVLHSLGVLAGSYLAAAGAIALLTLAVGAAVVGSGAVFGRHGVIVSAVVVFLFGNPISAAATAPQLLPEPWGAIGQLLPAGAGGTLLRSAAFFDGAGAAASAWTLVIWAAAGAVLIGIGGTGAGAGRRRGAVGADAVSAGAPARSPATA